MLELSWHAVVVYMRVASSSGSEVHRYVIVSKTLHGGNSDRGHSEMFHTQSACSDEAFESESEVSIAKTKQTNSMV
jgi:hypothetical protein